MQQRGEYGTLVVPVGLVARTSRAPPRRASRGLVLFRSAVAHNREHKVVALGNGRYRLFTIITTESIVTEDELAKLGLAPQQVDLPWTEGEPKPPMEWSRKRSPTAQQDPDTEAAVTHWRQHVGEATDQLKGNMKGWLKEFGLPRVKGAFDAVAINRPRASTHVKYKFLVDLFRAMRKGGGL